MHSDFNKSFERQPGNNKPLVLVIDDDRDNLLLASCVIEGMGMNFAVTNDSEQCMELAQEFFPNLILLNIVMPKISGLELIAILKKDKNLATIPVIAVTGLTKPEDKHKIIQAGFDDYLSKPYLIEDLETKLRTSIEPHSV